MKPPNYCNSINCPGNLDKDYCINGCSHAQWVDILMVNGKKWSFEYNRFGPVFLRKDGNPKVNKPGEGHPVWNEFEKWKKIVLE